MMVSELPLVHDIKFVRIAMDFKKWFLFLIFDERGMGMGRCVKEEENGCEALKEEKVGGRCIHITVCYIRQ